MHRSSYLTTLLVPLAYLLLLAATGERSTAQSWQAITVPGAWESQIGEHDGFGWYRCFVEVPADWAGSRLLLTVRTVDDVDEAYFNGSRVGANGGMPPLFGNPSSDVRRPAVIDPDQIRFGQMNLIAFRVYDQKGRGGIVEGPIQLGRLTDAIDLSGRWDFIAGDQREYAHWPNQNPDSVASRSLLEAYQRRHPEKPAGHLGIVPADVEGRERDIATVRQRFEGNSNVHSNVEGKGPPKSPAEALAALQAGPDLVIETVLHEPLVRQPLYVEFDARGRMWVTQYIQYPKPAGLNVLTWDNHLRSVFDVVPPPPPYDSPATEKFIGRDRISIHEDGDGDGTYETHKVFADGLNIVTSTCQGKGGVWVMNPPYLLFFPDADRDDVPDAAPVVHLSGFGLEDTHSVANSLKWGPDGWLYGCTGSTVTARVKVAARPEQAPLHFFGQNVWRYHPESHDFELFAEGGWNTFGVDFDAVGRLYSGTNGSMQAVYFVQGGFYQKGFGKHGPHTNPHAFDYFYGIPIAGKHQRLVQQWLPYDGGAFPGYQGHFIGVNCLANRVPVIALEPDGSTFRSRVLAPAMESEDVWFRPIHAALGPDGNVYVSDFYDARITHVDPRDNWDRDHGRIYRLRHRTGTPHPPLDLSAQSTETLVGLLDHPNQWHRWTARRLLCERSDTTAIPRLQSRLIQRPAPGQGALEALWALHGLNALSDQHALAGLQHPNLHVRLWTIRLFGDRRESLPAAIYQQVLNLAESPEPELISQLAASLQRLPTPQALPILERILSTERFSSDPYIPSQLWWALEKHLTRDLEQTSDWLQSSRLWVTPIGETKLAALIGRRLAADPTSENLNRAATLLGALPNRAMAVALIRGLETGLKGIALPTVPDALGQALSRVAGQAQQPEIELLTFALRLDSAKIEASALEWVRDRDRLTSAERQTLLSALAENPTANVTQCLLDLAIDDDPAIQRAALNGLRRVDHTAVPARLLEVIPKTTDTVVRTTALSVLAGRKTWAHRLLAAVSDGTLRREWVPLDQLLVMRGHGDTAIEESIRRLWGSLRQPDEAKKKRLQEIHSLIEAPEKGDAQKGAVVFSQICASCHRLFERGGVIGPDLTGYERSNLEFLIAAIVDPNLGVREEYELTTVTLRPSQQADGGELSPGAAVVSGFVKELTATQLTLQDLTGQELVIARRDVLRQQNSPVSIMPEGLLDTLEDDAIRDLFAYLQATTDPKPSDPKP